MRKYLLIMLALSISLSAVIGFSKSPTALAATSSGGNIIVQTIPGPTVAQKLTERTKSSWSWYVARGSGLVAAAALIVLVLSGIGQVTGYTYKFLDPLTAWASHRALGIAFGVSVLIHMTSLLFDHFVPFNILQVLVPWLSSYKPATVFGMHLGSLWVALGVLAFYGVVLVIVTSLLWVEKKPYTWKLFHLLAYVILLFVFVHALYLGTDLVHGVYRWLWIILGIITSLAVLHRLWRAKTV